MRSRTGATLLECLVVMTVLGLCTGTALIASTRALNTMIVHGAARDVAELFALARDRAIASGRRTAVLLDTRQQRLVVHAASDTLAILELRDRHITLEVTRDSMAYSNNGLGYGAANLRAVLTRGSSQDTLTVSRLGRVKR